MSDPETTKAVLVNGRLYVEQPDGSLRPSAGKTDFARLATLTEDEIEAAAASDPDALPMSDAEWAAAMRAPRKRYIHLGVDDDVLTWFKAHGRGYQTRINAVLRRYIELQKKAG